MVQLRASHLERHTVVCGISNNTHNTQLYPSTTPNTWCTNGYKERKAMWRCAFVFLALHLLTVLIYIGFSRTPQKILSGIFFIA